MTRGADLGARLRQAAICESDRQALSSACRSLSTAPRRRRRPPGQRSLHGLHELHGLHVQALRPAPASSYRRFHHTRTAMPNSKPGRIASASQLMNVLCCSVSVIGRLSGSRGRMAIRFSCCASQFAMLRPRSRLPGMLIERFVMKSLSPTTTTRVSGLGASGVAGRRRRRLRRGSRDRRDERDRPGLVAFVELLHGLARRKEPLEIGLRPAPPIGLDDLLRELAVGAAFDRRDRPRERKPRQEPEPFGDRVRQRGCRAGPMHPCP